MGEKIRRLVGLALLILAAHAVWRVGPMVLSYIEFRDRATETARYSAGRSEADIRRLIVAEAEKLNLPVDAKAVLVHLTDHHVQVEAAYHQDLPFLPGYVYPYDFKVSVDVLIARPVTLDQIR